MMDAGSSSRCEKMEDMIFSDLTFEQPGMRGVITILSDDVMVPKNGQPLSSASTFAQPRA